MGGEETEVSAEPEAVLLEAANFEQLGVLLSGERLRVRSEAQTRWEKGVAPEMAEPAAVYATQLLVELCGARWMGETDVKATFPAAPGHPAPARARRAGRRHPDPAEDEQRRAARAARLRGRGDWTVQVPAWRARDVKREIDLVEEVARFRLEDVPPTMPERTEMFGRLSHEQRLRRAVSDLLVGCGFVEAYTYSLQPSDPDPAALALPVPLSEQQRVLRTTLLHGLVRAAQHNVNVGSPDVALFEIAHVYLPTDGPLPREPWRLAGIVRGGFFRAKGVVEEMFDALKEEPRFAAATLAPWPRPPARRSRAAGWRSSTRG